MQKLSVKICCIGSIEEAELAIKYGATEIGLVGNMPSGPGIISDALIQQIASAVGHSVSTFLLTSETNPTKIISHYKRCNTTTIQIVDTVEIETLKIIRCRIDPSYLCHKRGINKYSC